MIQLDSEGPLQQQVYRALRAEILSRKLAAGERLPSTRALAAFLKVSRNTAVLAYDQLAAEGYTESRSGGGTVVIPALADGYGATAPSPLPRQDRSVPGGQPRLAAAGERMLNNARSRMMQSELRPSRLPYDFRFGRPAFADFPHALWCRLLGRRARRASVRDLDYGPPEGRLELREALAERLRRLRGVDVTPERIVIVNGSQQALDLVSRVLLNAGDRVLIEEPHYTGARSAFSAAGAELVPAPVDDEGIQVPRKAMRGRSPRLVYVTPSHQFPTGVVLPLVRRLELLDWASRANAYIVEDDYDSEFRYDGRPLQALAGIDRRGRVIYVGTFSKIMFPALRLGYLVLPESLVEAIAAAKTTTDSGTATLEQLALADFIGGGHFERHLHKSSARNAVRRSVLLDAIREHFGERAEVCGTNAGLHVLVWLRGRNGGMIAAVRQKAESVGVGLYSVAPFYLEPPRRTGVLLGYGPLHEREIREGIRRLAKVLV
ncbi:MAG: PLP-dependent aminotransferase family protein [Candidatus Binataceae bacterium]